MQRGNMVRHSADHAANTRKHGRETDDRMQRCDHLRELCRSYATSDDRANRSTNSRDCRELRENLRREADCGKRSEDA
jgi:hypothetical protein